MRKNSLVRKIKLRLSEMIQEKTFLEEKSATSLPRGFQEEEDWKFGNPNEAFKSSRNQTESGRIF